MKERESWREIEDLGERVKSCNKGQAHRRGWWKRGGENDKNTPTDTSEGKMTKEDVIVFF